MNNDPAHNLNHLRIQINIGGLDLAEWLERLAVNAKVVTVLPASSDTVESDTAADKSVLNNLYKKRKKKII
jgi:hypothetical protein